MKTRWYVLIGSVLILIVMAVAHRAHADVIVNQNDHTVQYSTNQAWTRNYVGWQSVGCFTIDESSANLDGVSAYFFDAMAGAGTMGVDMWSSTDCTTGYITHINLGSVTVSGGGAYVSASSTYSLVGVRSLFVDGNSNNDCMGSTCLGGIGYYGDATGYPSVVVYDDGAGQPPPVDDTSRIISVIPSGGATTSPVALSMTYYSSATSSIPLDTVSLDLRSIEGGGVSTLELSSTAATGTITTWSASSSATLPDGLYTAFWSLSSSESILYHIATSTSFIVGTSTWQELISLASTTPSATCSIVDIGGCMQSVIAWAFLPSTQSQELLAQSGSALLHAPPLGYYYTYRDTIKIAFSTTTIDEVMATSTRAALISIIDPMRTGAIAVFWAGWLVAQYAFFMRFILPLV